MFLIQDNTQNKSEAKIFSSRQYNIFCRKKFKIRNLEILEKQKLFKTEIFAFLQFLTYRKKFVWILFSCLWLLLLWNWCTIKILNVTINMFIWKQTKLQQTEIAFKSLRIKSFWKCCLEKYFTLNAPKIRKIIY